MSIDILSRWSGAVLRSSKTAQTIAEAVVEAVRRNADLREADLSNADLRNADLREADLNGVIGLSQAKNFVIGIQGSRHQIIAVDDDIRIGCQRYCLAVWLATFAVVGEQQGYTSYEIEEYGDHLRYIERRLEAWRKKAEAAQ